MTKQISTKITTMTHAEWLAEAERRFGPDAMKWRFVCPSCGYVASVQDWKDAGATEGEVSFSCVGRRRGADDAQTFQRKGGPCQYAGGGLFGLNPVVVEMPNGKKNNVFAFAEAQSVKPVKPPRRRRAGNEARRR